MKKVLTIFLIPVFILTAIVGINSTSYSCKGMEGKYMAKPCCKNTGKDGCCKKESLILKIQDVFIKAVNNSNLSAASYFMEQNSLLSLDLLFKNASYANNQWAKAPPATDVGFYILYRSLII